jgi:hypothetical protein
MRAGDRLWRADRKSDRLQELVQKPGASTTSQDHFLRRSGREHTPEPAVSTGIDIGYDRAKFAENLKTMQDAFSGTMSESLDSLNELKRRMRM